MQTVLARLHRLIWARRIGRFAVVGAVNTVFGLACYPILFFALKPLRPHYMVVLPLSYAVSIGVSYATNKRFVFRSRRRSVAEVLRFSSFYCAAFAINAALLPLAVEMLGLHPVVAQVALGLTVAATSYLWHARVTFRQGGAADAAEGAG